MSIEPMGGSVGGSGRNRKPITILKWPQESKPQTNADRIRAMSDEELAEFIAPLVTVTKVGEELAKERWLEWLKREVSDNE